MTPQLFATIVGLLFTFAGGIAGVTLYVEKIKRDGAEKTAAVASATAAAVEAVGNLALRLNNVERRAEGTHDEVTGPKNMAIMKLQGDLALVALRVENTPTKADFAVVATKLDTLIEQGKKRS